MSLQSLPDASVVERCRTGDHQAWDELVDRYSRYVFAIATQAFRLPSTDAEDVFQEVFARTYEHLGRLRDDSAIRPWFGQLTRRLCIDHLRRRARETPTDEDVEPQGWAEGLERLDDALTVRAAMTALPEHCREVLDRFFARDESYQTIGEALDIPPGTIASRISRCLGKLRTQLVGREMVAGPS
jgi:RNA polymerase sigma-70 factor (ECF subfamily)